MLVKAFKTFRNLRVMEVRLGSFVPVRWQSKVSAAAAQERVIEIWPYHEVLIAITGYVCCYFFCEIAKSFGLSPWSFGPASFAR